MKGIIRKILLFVVVANISLVRLSAQEEYIPYLRSVVLNNDSVLVYSANDLSPDSIIKVDWKYNTIHFELDVSDFFKPDNISDKIHYAFFLEGHDLEWGMWSPYPVKDYTDLPSGRYILSVRYGSSGSIWGESQLISFQIGRPFLLRAPMIVIYSLLLVTILVLLYRLSIRRHLKEQERLEIEIAERTEELLAEKAKSDTLLANLLPKGTADELMETGRAKKQKFNFVTVLFSDIQGFTKIAEEVNPEELIDELDKFFFQFDNVVEKYNIEKIKTIGDAYMCAGGIPRRNRTNPIEVILAALEMQQYMLDMKEDQVKRGLVFWDIRIGIHTGTVIAGVVGHKKMSYDIWGDTVNTASRMESSGEPGKINISGVTYDYIRDFFICEYRGKMPVKYKGELDMYFVNGIRPELRAGSKNEPNRQFRNKMLLIKITDIEDEVADFINENITDDYKFHNLRYIKNISTQAELIGRAEKFSEEDMIILLTAAAFILTGYVKNYNDPFRESALFLKKVAPTYGFDEELVEKSASAIFDAVIPVPKTLTGQVLSDSMLDHYGRVDLIDRLKLQIEEELCFDRNINTKEWFRNQAKIISEHKFYTETANLLRSIDGEAQAERIERYIDSIRDK